MLHNTPVSGLNYFSTLYNHSMTIFQQFLFLPGDQGHLFSTLYIWKDSTSEPLMLSTHRKNKKKKEEKTGSSNRLLGKLVKML